MRLSLLTLSLLLAAPGAFAQEASGTSVTGSATMAQLLSQGYEIKAAVPNGGKIVIFMQKDQSAYACEFASLANTRCGSIN